MIGGRLSGQELLDMVLVGLLFLHEEQNNTPKMGNGILQTLRQAGALNESQRGNAVKSYDLAKLAKQRSLVLHGRNVAGPDDAWLVIHQTDQFFSHGAIFGPHGYALALTEAGLNYARSVEATYAARLNRVRFVQAWIGHARQMRAFHARLRSGAE